MKAEDAIRRAAELLGVPFGVAAVKVPRFALHDRLLDAGENELAAALADRNVLAVHERSALTPLVGRTVHRVGLDDDVLYLDTDAGVYAASVEGDCCSNSWLFRVRGLAHLTGREVLGVVETAAGRSARGFAAHSLRAGLITQAAMAGVSERAIQDQSGHKSLAVMRRYIRDGSLFRENAAAKVGL